MIINYSVIIPFRDCTDLLRKACESIPERRDIQVIVVDNAMCPIGEDATKSFNRSNIEYYTSSPSKGAGCARNEGMRHAKGLFLLFLDADDYYSKDAFSHFDACLDTDCDIVYFNATSVKITTGQQSTRHLTIDEKIKKYIEGKGEDILRYSFLNPVCKMIRRSLVVNNNIEFQEVPVSNDVMFSTKTGFYANRVTAVNQIVYVITEGDVGSSLTKTPSVQNQFCRFRVAIDQYKFLKLHNKEEYAISRYRFILYALKTFGLKESFKWLFYAINNKGL